MLVFVCWNKTAHLTLSGVVKIMWNFRANFCALHALNKYTAILATKFWTFMKIVLEIWDCNANIPGCIIVVVFLVVNIASISWLYELDLCAEFHESPRVQTKRDISWIFLGYSCCQYSGCVYSWLWIILAVFPGCMSLIYVPWIAPCTNSSGYIAAFGIVTLLIMHS